MANNYSFRGLRELRGSGYEIMSGEPDIIGWSIRDTTDRKLGVVHDLLFDPEQQKVRYIIASLKDNDYDFDRRKVLIPIGVAQLHENNDNVILNAITAWQIRALPSYDKNMSDQDEQDIVTIFSTTNATLSDGTSPVQENRYDHTHFDYGNLFRNRQKDRPANKALGIKQRENYDSTTSSRELDSRNAFVHDEEDVAVRNQRDKAIEEINRRHEGNTKDRLIDRIQHLKEDLNQIERDLRSTRDL